MREADGYQYVIVFTMVLGSCATKIFRFYLRTSRCSDGCAGILLMPPSHGI